MKTTYNFMMALKNYMPTILNPDTFDAKLLLKFRKSWKKNVVLYSSKKRTMGQFYVLKIAPAFIFWKNPGRHNLLLRFTDL